MEITPINKIRVAKNREIRTFYYELSRMKFNRTLFIIFALAGLLPPLAFRIIGWYNGNELGSFSDFIPTLLISSFTTVTISYGVVSMLFWLQKNYPWSESLIKRLFLEIFLTTFTACGIIVILTIIHHIIDPIEDLKSTIVRYTFIAIIMNFVLVTLTEGIFFFRQWRDSVIEAERYKRDSITAQFESLKNQVNPHFLFNSLNTLSGLIDKDKEMSKDFLDNLASVYRYVLEHKDEEIVTIQTELEFIDAYVQLLKKRHGDKISFNISINGNVMNRAIPPISLQMLVENAVKHNVASRKKPLTIEIYDSNNYLVVRNNLQTKNYVKSTGVGLDNIKSRYEYLGDRNIEINKNESYFEIRIPLLDLNSHTELPLSKNTN